MTLPPIRIAEEGRDWAMAASEEVAGAIRDAINARGGAGLVLTGGRSAALLYRNLSMMPYLQAIDWSRVTFYWGDERCVPPDSEHSNFRLAHEALLSRLPATGSFYRIPGEAGSSAADAYARTLRTAFAATTDEPPRFDVILLGMGADGHVASLFPDTPDLRTDARWAVATTSPLPPRSRISLTLRVINAARTVMFLVTGEEKALVLRQVFEYDPAAGEAPVPAALVRPIDGRVLWLVGREAASLLRRT